MDKMGILALMLLCGCQQAMPQIALFGTMAEPTVEASRVNYVLVMEVQEVVPGQSYAVACSPERPNCDTVYAFTQKMIPFNSLREVRDYLSSTPNKFIKLFSLTEVPVTVKETVTTIPQPPVTQTKKTYTVGGKP